MTKMSDEEITRMLRVRRRVRIGAGIMASIVWVLVGVANARHHEWGLVVSTVILWIVSLAVIPLIIRHKWEKRV